MIKYFLIATILPIYFLHYYLVYNNKNKNYSFFSYVLIAPLYFGVMNIIKNKFFSKKYINNLFITLISSHIVFLFSFLTNKYNYSNFKWFHYYIRLLLLHFYIYNIIYILEWYLF